VNSDLNNLANEESKIWRMCVTCGGKVVTLILAPLSSSGCEGNHFEAVSSHILLRPIGPEKAAVFLQISPERWLSRIFHRNGRVDPQHDTISVHNIGLEDSENPLDLRTLRAQIECEYRDQERALK
jgi:hypothetical protein